MGRVIRLLDIDILRIPGHVGVTVDGGARVFLLDLGFDVLGHKRQSRPFSCELSTYIKIVPPVLNFGTTGGENADPTQLGEG